MIPSQRHLFDIPDDITYLNCAYMSPLMHSVVQAGHHGITGKARPWTITPQKFFTESEETRSLFAQLIGADANSIAIVPAVSYAMATAALNLPFMPRQEIVVLRDQFPSNVYPWAELARHRDGMLTFIERPPASNKGTDWTPAILEAISERTAIVALPHCHWTDGALIDLVAVGRAARAHGAALVLDLTQSLGALPFNIAGIQPDFAVAACYKWLLGPYSIGFMYVAPRWHEGNPLEEGWIARNQSEDFTRLVEYQSDYQPGARRFDMGERSNFHLMPMAKAALEQVLDWSVEEIATTLSVRTGQIAGRAQAFGLTASAPHLRAGHYLGLRFPKAPPPGLIDRLCSHNVYVSLRGDSMRVTPHLYNTDTDVERFFAALQDTL